MKRSVTRRELFALTPASAPDELIHIASLLVHATPAACEAIKQLLHSERQVEVHDTAHPGKLAIVLESANDRAIADTACRLQEIAGVVSVSVVAHMVEAESALREDRQGG